MFLGWYNFIKGVLCVAYFITENCVSCGACEGECPVSCISQGEERFVIDPDQCIECGACSNICPVGAPQQQ